MEQLIVLQKEIANCNQLIYYYTMREQEVYNDYQTGELTDINILNEKVLDFQYLQRHYQSLIDEKEVEIIKIRGICIAFSD